eukprot:TRINITY_DN69551_c0_g1_i1.p1 TRINITY_DN69551_c0_g1~~TRINITY_DN69551_c0_g1_i1.p1  ORF type:complete len:597 (-),score=75.04 TRINITY_DN69551_c0_g1_i1:219-2009(-)
MDSSRSATDSPIGDASNDSILCKLDKKSYGAVVNGGSSDVSSDSVSNVRSCQQPQSMLLICGLICGVELCERLAFYTFNGTQAFFLERVGYSLAAAGGINSSMVTLCMAWTLLAGWIADAYLGRFRTILVFGMLYTAGSFCAAAAARPGLESSAMYLFGLMVLVPLGTAGIKANISNFGADQFDVSTVEGKAAQEQFFSWFYVSINIGAAFSYGFLTTFATTGGLGVDAKYGYLVVYTVAAFAMVIAVVLFSAGRSSYVHRPVLGSSSLGVAFNHLRRGTLRGSTKAALASIGIFLMVTSLVLSVFASLGSFPAAMRGLTMSAAVCSGFGILFMIVANMKPDWVDEFEQVSSDISAADIRDFFRIMPVVLCGQLAFGALYNSMQFWYQHQACQMDLRMVAGSSQQVSGSFFNVADCVAIILCTPLLVGVVHPFIEARLGFKLSVQMKYSTGIMFGTLSVVVAIYLEFARRAAPGTGIPSNCAPAGIQMSSLPARWMMMPYFLMGIGEIYSQPSLMFLTYNQSPPSMRTLSAVTSLFMMGVTTSMFAILGIVVEPWMPDDLNDGHIEYGYYANIGIAMFFLSAFYMVLRRFEWKTFS